MEPAPHDPYRPPSAAEAVAFEPTLLAPVPFDGAWNAVVRGYRVYFAHFRQLALIVLVVHAPYELAMEWLRTRGLGDVASFRLEMFASSLVGALSAPAVLYSLAETARTGVAPPVGESLRYGVQRWPHTFKASLAAGLLALLGLVLFIVPGVVAMIRYSFTDEVLSLERRRFKTPLERSKQLARGHEWRLLGTFLLVLLAPMLLAALVGEVEDRAANPTVNVLGEVLNDLAWAVSSCTWFVVWLGLVHAGNDRWTESLPWVPEPAALPEAPVAG